MNVRSFALLLLLLGCSAQPALPPLVGSAPPPTVTVVQEDAIAPLGSDMVARVVTWFTWDVGLPRAGDTAFFAVAVASGPLSAPPAWRLYYDAARAPEALALARRLAEALRARVTPRPARIESVSFF